MYVLICLDFVEPCTFGVWRDIHHFCSYSQLWARLLNRGNCLMLKRKIKHDPSSFQCNSLTDIICDVFSYRFGKFWWRNTLITHTVAKFSERTSSTLVWVESGAKVPAELRVRMQRIRSYQLMSRITYQCYSGCALTGIQTERSIYIFWKERICSRLVFKWFLVQGMKLLTLVIFWGYICFCCFFFSSSRCNSYLLRILSITLE